MYVCLTVVNIFAVPVCKPFTLNIALNVTTQGIAEGKYENVTTINCKEGYKRRNQTNNGVATWSATCDKDGHWTPIVGCDKKGLNTY